MRPRLNSLLPVIALWASSVSGGVPVAAADLAQDAKTAVDVGEAAPDTVAGTQVSRSRVNTAYNELNGRMIDVTVIRQPLAGVLETIAEQAKVTVTIEKGMTATLTDLRLKGTVRMCMDEIANRIGAVWWWRGQELRIASNRHSVTRTIKSRNAAALMGAAADLGFPVHVLGVKKASGLGMLRITGPAALVADVETLAADVDKQLNTVQMLRYGKNASN